MAFMEIETTFGLWYLVETNYETQYVPPGLVSLPLSAGEAITDNDIDDLLDSASANLAEEGTALRSFASVDSDEARIFADWLEENGRTDDSQKVRRYADWLDAIASLNDYIHGDVQRIEARECWGARYSAPGYLDATDWTLGDTEEEAVDECRAIYGEEEEEADSHICNDCGMHPDDCECGAE